MTIVGLSAECSRECMLSPNTPETQGEGWNMWPNWGREIICRLFAVRLIRL